MARTVRIVLYAINGSGVGHLTRLVAVGRWIRRYSVHAGVSAEVVFLTSSEADGVLFAERFASFKLPSKTAVARAGMDKLAYLALAKQWIWHSMTLLRPDLFVVDTFPRGSFGELLPALDLCRKKAFIYRPVKDELASRADFQATLPLYDSILIPESEGDAAPPFPAAARRKVRHTGPVLVREREELWPRAAVREHLQIEGDRLAVYVSAGGGGDEGAEAQIGHVCRALGGRRDLCLVVAAGPLYRGRRLHGEGLRWLNEPGAAELMGGMDLAVCAAGYNTYHELMHAGVPAVFLPQAKIADEQRARAGRAAAAGAGVVLGDALCADELIRAVDRLCDPAERARASGAAAALVPRNHASAAAAELLRHVLPPAEVEAAEEAVSRDVLAAARELSLGIEGLIDLMHALRGPDSESPGGARAASELATGLLRAAAAAGAPPEAAAKVGAALALKLGRSAPEDRALAVRRVLDALTPFEDWPAASTCVKLLRSERRSGTGDFVEDLCGFLGALRARGQDLYSGVALLSAAQGVGREGPTNREAVLAAMERLGRPLPSHAPLGGGDLQ